MYLLIKLNFNFSYVLHVIREFLACILVTRLTLLLHSVAWEQHLTEISILK